MRRLAQRDLVSILDFLRGAGAIGGPRTFAAYVTSELPRVIPSALTAFAELDLVKRSVRWVMDPADPSLPNVARIFAAHIHDNPFVLYRKRTGDAEAVRLSDITTAGAFCETGLYRDFYRPLHLHYSMGCALRLTHPELAEIALYRSRGNFSERDGLCLNVLRPHLVHLLRNAEVMARIRRDLALVSRGVEVWNHSFLMIDPDGRIRRGAERAQQWLARYFGSARRPDALPVRLQEWLQWRDRMDGSTDALPPVRQPLVVQRGDRRLTVRVLSQPPDRLLLLEETGTRLEPAALARLGLSAREAEVLASAAGGKTNRAIAALLHISPRTVQTHLERIYRKLAVQTRTAATARALEAVHDGPGE